MKQNQVTSPSPKQKIQVFISSKCDKYGESPKYNPIREKIKFIIENTGLADVYTFENEEGSTLASHDGFKDLWDRRSGWFWRYELFFSTL